jgi:CBS domain-containing protein
MNAATLLAADVLHPRSTTLPVTITVGELRRWFAANPHKRIAILADGDYYRGSVTRSDVNLEQLDETGLAAAHAHPGPTVAPDTPASVAHEIATRSDIRRVPVVDPDGRLVGVVAVTEDLARFCGTGHRLTP